MGDGSGSIELEQARRGIHYGPVRDPICGVDPGKARTRRPARLAPDLLFDFQTLTLVASSIDKMRGAVCGVDLFFDYIVEMRPECARCYMEPVRECMIHQQVL